MDRIVFGASLVLLIVLLVYLSVPKTMYNVSGEISHDDEVWYCKNKSTCVCYGKEGEKCDYTRCVCAGGKDYGSTIQQMKLVNDAISNGGEAKECPIIHL